LIFIGSLVIYVKKRELSLILCLSLVWGGVALAYLPFAFPAYPPILLINACPQFWLGKKVIVFEKLQAVVEQRFVKHPYDYVLHDPIVGAHIGVRLDMAHIYIWPLSMSTMVHTSSLSG
jgi:hypothetical protein